jgi:hypothetical protein
MQNYRSIRLAVIGIGVVALFGFLLPSSSLGFDIEIDVAPHVLNLQSASTVVTIHTDIDFGDVMGSTIFLNGVAISHWKSDARGNFVAKFVSDEIKALDGLIVDDYNTLVLTGYTVDGEAFIGSQDIWVIDTHSRGDW